MICLLFSVLKLFTPSNNKQVIIICYNHLLLWLRLFYIIIVIAADFVAIMINSNKSQKIIALQKTQANLQNGPAWNNEVLKWFVLHVVNDLDSKTYEIALEIVYLSSKRQVKVNGEVKHSAMATFGYESDFEIGPGLKGKIKQEGVQFKYQLFLNGVSFTQLQNNKPVYEPLSELSIPEIKESSNKMQKGSKQSHICCTVVEQPTKIKSRGTQKEFQNKKSEPADRSQEQKIKETQAELFRILKAQKTQKK